MLRSRNRARDLHVGGDVINFGPVNGAPNVTDRERGRRFGDHASLIEMLKINHALGICIGRAGWWWSRSISRAVRHLYLNKAHIEHSDIVWATRGIGRVLRSMASA